MKMTKILTISAFAITVSACSSSQSQIEGAAPALATTGPAHVHNVQGYGDFTHSHKGNSTAQHGHSWADIQQQIKGQ